MASLGFIFYPSPDPKQTAAPVDFEWFLPELRDRLTASIRKLAVLLHGEPNKARSTRRDLRFGNQGSRSVVISGPKKGLWCSYEGKEGSDPLGLIWHERRGSFLDAVRFGLHFAGMPDHLAGEGDGRTDEQREADQIAREEARTAAAAASAVEAARDEARRVDIGVG